MYKLCDKSEISVVDVEDDVSRLFRPLFRGLGPVMITREGRLFGYVHADHVERTFSPQKRIADYRLGIDFVTADAEDILDVQTQVHSEVLRRFGNAHLQFIPVCDQQQRLIGACRRIRGATPDDSRLPSWVRAKQSEPGFLATYLRDLFGVSRIALWVGGDNSLASLVINECWETMPPLPITALYSDYGSIMITDPIDGSELWSQSSQDLSELSGTDLLVVVGGSPHLVTALRRRTKVRILRLEDVVDSAERYWLGTRILIDKSRQLAAMGVETTVVCSPSVMRIKNPSDREREIIGDPRPILPTLLRDDPARYISRIAPVKSDLYSLNEYVDLIARFFPMVIPRKNYTINADTSNLYFHYDDGRRYIPGAPDHYDNTIYIVGDSSGTNYYGNDSETIAAYLQQRLNASQPTLHKQYRVVDMACSAQTKEQTANLISDLPLVAGDQVFIVAGGNLGQEFPAVAKREGVPYFDLSHLLDRPHDYGEVFVWHGVNHVNWRGHSLMADWIADHIQASDGCDTRQPESTAALASGQRRKLPSILISEQPPLERSAGFQEYLTYLATERVSIEGKVGAIVVNCNPFTLGHRYLIETAAQAVDLLYVFVVEEDRSVFPFADRLELVRLGTQDLSNVKVLRSGRFIISSLTFPDYFIKDQLQTAEIDPSNDVRLFGQYICPRLGITMRLAGEEPLDLVTRQYNSSMASLLPKMGVEFRVIARKEEGGTPISASRVRSLLEAGRFDEIAALVPVTTLAYLVQNAEELKTKVRLKST